MSPLFPHHRERRIQEFLDWFDKRMVMMSPSGGTALEQSVSRELAAETQPLRTAIEGLITGDNVTKEQVETAIAARISAVQGRMQQMITDLPTRRSHFESVRDRVVAALNALKARIFTALESFGLADRTTKLQSTHHAAFRTFIQRVAPTATPAPAPAPTPPPAPRTRPTVAPDTSRPYNLDNAQTREAFRGTLYRSFLGFANTWQTEGWIDNPPRDGNGRIQTNRAIKDFAVNYFMALSRGVHNSFAYRGYTGEAAGLAFMADKMGGATPTSSNNDLRNLIRSSYRVFDTYARAKRDSDPNIRQLMQRNPTQFYNDRFTEFFGSYRDSNNQDIPLTLTFNADGTISSSNPEVNRFITARQPRERREERVRRTAVVERQWQEEVRRQPETVTRTVETTTLDTVGTALNRGELPSREDLLRIQGLVNRVNTSFMGSGNTLDWGTVNDVSVVNGQYGTSDRPLINGLPGGSLRIEARPGDRSHPTLINVQHRGGHLVDVDVPRLMETLRTLRSSFPELTAGRTGLNLGEIADQLSPANRERAQERLDRLRYRRTLQAFGIENLDQYTDIPRALTRLLRLSDRNRSVSVQTWIDGINATYRSETMSADDYRFLWVLRSYVRTRRIEGSGNLNATQFSQLLLSSRQYRRQDRIQDQVPIYGLVVAAMSRVYRGRDRVNMVNDITDEYDDYLTRVPAVRNLFRFATLIETSADGVGAYASALKTLPWSQVSRRLELAASTPYEAVSNGVRCIVVNSGGTTGGNLLIPKVIVDAYVNLRRTNPLFADLIAQGTSVAASDTTGHTFQNILYRIYTPAMAEATVTTSS